MIQNSSTRKFRVTQIIDKRNWGSCLEIGKTYEGLYTPSNNSRVLPMVALLKTKLQITNKMTTKNETPKNDFNATIGNSVLSAVLIIND